MKAVRRSLYVLMLGSLCACSTARTSVKNNSRQSVHRLLQQDVMSVLWYQHAAECRALYYQAFNVAHDRLEHILAVDTTGLKKAVVVDIDETVLNNSPWQAYSILKDAPFPEEWDQWIKSAEAEATPGAVDFLRYAVGHGVDVYYISNRKEDNLPSTIKNLKRWNFPEVDASHILLKTTTSDKTERRQRVEETHKIVLLMGDNLGDFEQLFQGKSSRERNHLVDQNSRKFGKRFIVLPNPMYGEWEGATYRYQYSKPAETKAKDRLNALQSFSRNSNYESEKN